MNFLPKIGDFFEIFEIYLHTTPQKSLFIAFLLTNFPKISKKVLKKFSRRLRRREKHTFGAFGAESVEKYLDFWGPSVEKPPPPFGGSPPPKKKSLWFLQHLSEFNF